MRGDGGLILSNLSMRWGEVGLEGAWLFILLWEASLSCLFMFRVLSTCIYIASWNLEITIANFFLCCI